MLNNILILGCARSGTSILGEFFEKSGLYTYLFEPTLPAHQYELAFEHVQRPLAAKKPRAPIEHAASFTPGLAFDYSRLAAVFPRPWKIVWIVRNPLDAICSLRPGIEMGWAHNPRPPGWRELGTAKWHIKCAAHWQYINNEGFLAITGEAEVVRFEDLVLQPRATAEKLLQYCGWPDGVTRGVEGWISQVSNNKGNSYEARLQDRWSENNHTRRVGRHRENLDADQINDVLPLVEVAASRFGYTLTQ